MSKSTIIQITPASNWFARYDDGGPGDCPLVGWALIEEEDGAFRYVVGLDSASGTVERCDEIQNFKDYVFNPKSPADGRKED